MRRRRLTAAPRRPAGRAPSGSFDSWRTLWPAPSCPPRRSPWQGSSPSVRLPRRTDSWLSLSREQPDRATIFGWLYVVATREAYRLCALDRRTARLENFAPATGWESVVADAFSIDDIVEAHEALAILASLPDRQRTDLTLLVAGYSYEEIRELTGGRTFTNVNKHLAKARARVRLARLRQSTPGVGSDA